MFLPLLFVSSFIRIIIRFVVVVLLAYWGCSDDQSQNDASQSDSAGNEDPGDNLSPQGTKSLHGSRNTALSGYHIGCQRFVSTPANAGGGSVKPTATVDCFRPNPSDVGPQRVVNVFFIRHAESEWNKVRNEANHKFVPNNPHLLDAHLSLVGVKQSVALANAIDQGKLSNLAEQDIAILQGSSVPTRKVLFASSNLRRAALTLLIGFRRIFAKPIQGTTPHIHIVSALQEKGAIDAQALTNPGEAPYLTLQDKCPYKKDDFATIFDTTCNDGNEMKRKQHLGMNLCHWIRRKTLSENITDFILVGHSNSLVKIFQSFFSPIGPTDPKDPAVILKNGSKLSNTGMIKFQLSTEPGKCSIVSGSTVLALGEIK